MPAAPDSRHAFLLLDSRPPHQFTDPASPAEYKLKLATLLGFFGMLRFDIILNFRPSQIVLVKPGGREDLLSRVPFITARSIVTDYIGFYFRFRGKSTPIGDPPQMAYCPKICDFDKQFEQFCPVALISVMHGKGYFLRIHRRLMHNVLTPKTLCAYIVTLAGRGLTQVQSA